MSNPLIGVNTRPESFSPAKNYAGVIARGDNWFGDFDATDIGKILRFDLSLLATALFRNGAIFFETGGVLAQPIPGVSNGADTLASAGTYVGTESQLYTVTIATGGVAGTVDAPAATYTWKATGSDGPQFGGTALPITAIAPDLETAQADPATYGHAVGRLGLIVYFLNPNRFLTAGNSWIVQATYGARSPVVSGDTITIADCLVHVEGRFHHVQGAAFTYAHLTSGISIVYGEWTRDYVDFTDDPDLTDPLSDTPEAGRERWRMVLRATDTSDVPLGPNEFERRVFPLYQWDRATDVVTPVIRNPYAIALERTEGSLDASRLLNVDQNELLRGLLADLFFSAFGDAVFQPLPPQPRATKSANAPSAGKIRLAYPRIRGRASGIPITLPPGEIEVDQALETALVESEVHTYTAAADAAGGFLLTKASAFPIAATIPKLLGIVQVGTGSGGTGSGYEAVTRGGTAYDALTHNPVTALLVISSAAGGGGTVYDQSPAGAANYELASDGGQLKVHWLTGGPSGGATYYVSYKYQKTMVQGTDFALIGAGAITFATLSGDNPVEGSDFDTDYNFYLPRHDALFLRVTQEMAVLRGLPAEQPDIAPLPLGALAYAIVEVAPNSNSIVIKSFKNDRFTVEDANILREEVSQIRRDLAELDLVNQARVQTAANILDTFVDTFATLTQADRTYDVAGHTFDATIDIGGPNGGELTLPYVQAILALAKGGSVPAGETDVQVGGDFWTLPFADELALQVQTYSFARPVNAYQDFRPPLALLRVEPAQDFFVDTTVVGDSETRLVTHGLRKVRTPPRATVVGGVDTTVQASETSEGVMMRQLSVALTGIHLVPGEKCRVKFAGQDVPFLADAPSVQTAAGNGNGATDAVTATPTGVTDVISGQVTGHFIIPASIPVGTVTIEVWGDSGVPGAVWPTDYTLRTSAPFTSNGILRTYAVETVVTSYPLPPRPGGGGSQASGVMLDPLAQSLVFDSPRMITAIDVPIAAVPAGDQGTPLIAEMRNTDRSGQASTPTGEVLASKILEQRDCAVGPTSSNVIRWRDPVYLPALEFRSFVLRTPSSDYQVYVAELGGPDRVAGGFVQQQALADGILMDSVNNADWTLHQQDDLRCTVYVAKMAATEAHLYLARLTAGSGGVPTNATALLVNPDQVVPDGTAITWQYSIDSLALNAPGKVWTTFVPYVLAEFASVAATIDIRAILTTTDPYVTPAINFRNLSAQVLANKAAGTYVGTAKLLTAAATKANGTLRYIPPPGDAPPDVYVSCDDGAHWTQVTLVPQSTNTITGEITATWTQASLTSGTSLRVRIELAAADTARRPRVPSVLAWTEP